MLVQAQDLPLPPTFDENQIMEKDEAGRAKSKSSSSNAKPLPKWLKIGSKSIKLFERIHNI